MHEHPHLGRLRQDGGDAVGELGVVDDAHEVGVVVEVAQLLLDVPEVHVDRHGADLEQREHRLEVLGAVHHVAADVVARTDADGLEVVRQPVGPLVELAEGQPAALGVQRLAVRDVVDDVLEHAQHGTGRIVRLGVGVQHLFHGQVELMMGRLSFQ